MEAVPSRALWLRTLRAALGVALVCVLTGASCEVHAEVSKGDLEPKAEAHYRAAWQHGWQRLAPLNRGLDACNVPAGTKQGCYNASQAMIGGVQAFLDELAAVHVPSRYQPGDETLRRALRTLVEGYARRNRGIATNDNADFIGGNETLKRANDLLKTAFGRFPIDAQAQLNPRP